MRNPYTRTTLSTAQSRNEEALAVLPAAASNTSFGGEWQVDTEDGTILQPILPNMGEAVLNQQHATVFEQQQSLLTDFNQSIQQLPAMYGEKARPARSSRQQWASLHMIVNAPDDRSIPPDGDNCIVYGVLASY
jgi:hypothetical protein